MSLELVRSFGPWMTISREPPPSRRRFGVPLGGPFDRESFEVACFLVDANEAFELALGTFTFVAFEDCSIGLAGSVGSVHVNDCPSGGVGIIPLRRGQQVEVAIDGGARAYLAWSVELRPPLILDQPKRDCSVLRYIPRPASDLDIDGRTLEVSPISDRSGIRFVGIEETHIIELPSEPMCIGAIQWTPDGTLIIIGPDGPTIGGYPQLGVICSADLNHLGQICPGEMVQLRAILAPHAGELRRAAILGLERRLAALRLATQTILARPFGNFSPKTDESC